MNITALIAAYSPSDGNEKKYHAGITRFLKQHGDTAFCHELLIGHITASAFLLNHNSTKFLLMHHVKLNKWLQLGGHCDGNTDVLAVALKEAQEESGISSIEPVKTSIFDIDIHHIPMHKAVPAHEHYDIRFLLKTVNSDTIQKNNESNELRWFSFNEELPTQEESVARMVRKAHAYCQ
jgi:8-oxo-dGTP pyrophosphatase MutT (NUDIX family)